MTTKEIYVSDELGYNWRKIKFTPPKSVVNPCRCCAGRGIVENGVQNYGHVRYVCPECKGTGERNNISKKDILL